MTHSELIERAEKWLRNSLNCRVVLTENVSFTLSGETPDAIGWKHNRCILVECKVSKSDFYSDRKKRSRNWNLPQKLQASGVYYPALGHHRFYLTPPDLLNNTELPEGWGWYEVHSKQVKHAGGISYANAKVPPCNSDFQSERALLVSALYKCRNGIK